MRRQRIVLTLLVVIGISLSLSMPAMNPDDAKLEAVSGTVSSARTEPPQSQQQKIPPQVERSGSVKVPQSSPEPKSATPAFKGFHHVGVIVQDMTRSLAFYQNVLGGTIALDLMMDAPAFGDGVGIPGAMARVVVLQIPDFSAGIELIQFISPPGRRTNAGSSSNEIGSAHMAFRVTDIGLVHKRLSDKGVRFVTTPSVFPAGHPFSGVKFCYLRDPDGALLEIIEFPQ